MRLCAFAAAVNAFFGGGNFMSALNFGPYWGIYAAIAAVNLAVAAVCIREVY